MTKHSTISHLKRFVTLTHYLVKILKSVFEYQYFTATRLRCGVEVQRSPGAPRDSNID